MSRRLLGQICIEFRLIERPFPFRDNEGGDRVSDDIRQRRARGHKAVNSKEKTQTAKRQGADRLQSGGKLDECATGDIRSPF